MMLHTKYQGSMPYVFREDVFNVYPYISLCKQCEPWAGLFVALGAEFEQTWYRSVR